MRSDRDGTRETGGGGNGGGNGGGGTPGAGGFAYQAGSSGAGSSSAGAATAGAFNLAGSSGSDEPNISGQWAMFAFEDPVAVRLQQNGNALSGYGCCSGLDGAAIPIACCGSIVGGSIENGRARFDFPVSPTDRYSADVFVSRAGDRMAGSFTAIGGLMRPMATAWVRIPANEKWISSQDDVLQNALLTRDGVYDLSLIEAGGNEVSADDILGLWVFASQPHPLVYGDLGPFWAGEMAWQEAEETLVIGPVPATSPELAVALELHFAGTLLMSVEATLPSGNSYVFSASRR